MNTGNKRGRPRYDDIITPAEWRTVEAVRHGLSNREIADRQNVSVDAVKFHMANVLQKLGLSSRYELKRWDGIDNTSRLHQAERKMSANSELGQIGQIARNVSDIAAATAWYRDMLGLPHLYSFGNLSFFDCNGTRLFLSQGDGKPEHNSVIYFKVGDIRQAYKILSEKGVAFTHAPHKIHTHEDGSEEWMAFIEDPDGQALGLMGTY